MDSWDSTPFLYSIHGRDFIVYSDNHITLFESRWFNFFSFLHEQISQNNYGRQHLILILFITQNSLFFVK